MKKRIVVVLSLAVAALTCFAALGLAAGASGKDAAFMKKAAEGGMLEVQLGQIAQQQATSQDVKNFGQRMVTDHSKANDELKALAQQKGVTLPGALNKKDQKMVDKMQKTKPEKFDKTYMKHMVKDHKKDVSDFKAEQKKAKDPDLKAWVEKTLPVLEDHLKQAEEIEKKL